MAIAIALAALVVFTGYNSTPHVNDAAKRARAFAARHHAAYPGPIPPPSFVNALVATEDQRFFSAIDLGVDPIALIHLILGASGLSSARHGGASIDQQLAKMLYTPNQSGSVLVDLEQVILATKLHMSYAPQEILRLYAEMAYFGDGYYGLGAAAQGYFGHPESELTALQAAMLAGLVNAPSADNPRAHPARAMQRCRHVIQRLVALHYLTQPQAETLLREPLGLVRNTTG